MMIMALSAPRIDNSDENLASQARTGDRTAYGVLIERHRNLCFAYALSILRDRDEADDAVQECFVKAWVHIDRYQAGRSWSGWMYTILRNECGDRLRRRKTRRSEELSPEIAWTGSTPEQQAMSDESRRRLVEAVSSLPEKFRTPILLHYVHQRTYREMAAVLDMKESTVIGRIAGAMRLLRRKMVVPEELQ